MTEIILVRADDWEALYINDSCIAQDHSVEDKEYFFKLGQAYPDATFLSYELNASGVDWIENGPGRFPENFSDIEMEYIYD